MRSRQVLVLLAVACGLLAMASVASATVIANGTYTAGNAPATLPSGNLIVQGSSTLSSSYAGGSDVAYPGTGVGLPGGMNDGVIGQANDINTMALWDGITSNFGYAVYTLNTAAAPAGYDVSEIDSYAGWTYMRAWQAVAIKYALVGETVTPGSELGHTLGSFTYQPAGTSSTVYAQTVMTIADDLGGKALSGISAIEVMYIDNNFDGAHGAAGPGNFSSYRELAVIGSPTTLAPEPSSIVLLVSAFSGLVAYGWRKRR
jgi:hypothetical protein